MMVADDNDANHFLVGEYAIEKMVGKLPEIGASKLS
jgi:hypothetical protein